MYVQAYEKYFYIVRQPWSYFFEQPRRQPKCEECNSGYHFKIYSELNNEVLLLRQVVKSPDKNVFISQRGEGTQNNPARRQV